MRIAVMDPYDHVQCFIDNDVPECMHFYDPILHTYLEGDAYTLEFRVATSEPSSNKLKEGNKLSFKYENRSYYLSVVSVERNPSEVIVTAWGLTLELTNEEVDATDNPKYVTMTEYINDLGFERDVLQVGTNEVASNKLRLKFDNRESILKRIYNLADAFGAEATFDVRLKTNYALDKIILNIYKKGKKIGAGQDKTAKVIRYGEGITGITKSADISGLYTGIRPRGKKSKRTVTVTTTTKDYGTIVFKTVETKRKDEQSEETTTVETAPGWSKTTTKMKYFESDDSTTQLPDKVYETGKKPKTPDKVNPTTKTNKTENVIESTLTLDGFGQSAKDANGDYILQGGDIRCPQARDRFPASLRQLSNGSFADGYIIKYLDASDCEDQAALWDKALTELKTNCVPQVSYTVSGYVEGNIGDWVTVEDAQYDPPVYLECRIVEQERNLLDESQSKTTFDNFTEMSSQISSDIMSRVNRLIADSADYETSIASTEGTVWQNDTKAHKFSPVVRNNGVSVLGNVSTRWMLDGVDVSKGLVKDGKVLITANSDRSITIQAAAIRATSVLQLTAYDSKKTRGIAEVTLQNIELQKINIDQDGNGTNITLGDKDLEGSFVGSWTIPNGKDGADGFSPTIDVSKSGKTATFKVTNKDSTQSVSISDGADGKKGDQGDAGPQGPAGPTGPQGPKGDDGKQGPQGNTGPKGADGVSPTVSLEKTGPRTLMTITDAEGSKTIAIMDGENGAKGEQGKQGPAGADGFSPLISASRTSTGVDISIRDVNGTTNVSVHDGGTGPQGPAGAGISSITGYYCRSTSATSVPADSSFSTTRPTLTSSYKYLWMYERYTCTDGSTVNGPKHIAAVYGDTGSQPSLNNTLTSASTTVALAANQGRVLKGYVDGLETRVAELESQISDILAGALAVLVKQD